MGFRSFLGLDARDFQLSKRLTVALLAPVVLAAPQLENNDLLGAVLAEDFGAHARTLDEGLADFGGVAAHEQHLIESQLVARVSGELFDAELLPLGDAVLLATRLDDCVHERSLSQKKGKGR